MIHVHPRLFPVLLISLDVLASINYAASGDWRRCIYWASAAVLTATVTF